MRYLNHVELGPTYRTTVGPFYPRLQAGVMQIMTTRQQMSYLFIFSSGDDGLALGLGVLIRVLSGQGSWVMGGEIAQADYTSVCHI
jgi:hypothetical protein